MPTSIPRPFFRHVAVGTLAVGALAGSFAVASAASNTSDGPARRASAVLVDTSGATVGFARFVEDATGTLHVNVKVSGLAPGVHGIHIHAVGSCAPTFAAAGSHHNPLGAPHGNHAGDLPMLVVNGAGQGRLNATTESATLSAGPISVFDLDGSALVVHADPDDFVTQPTGNSGARVACGVIVAGSQP